MDRLNVSLQMLAYETVRGQVCIDSWLLRGRLFVKDNQ